MPDAVSFLQLIRCLIVSLFRRASRIVAEAAGANYIALQTDRIEDARQEK
ncbi:hypothetical protein HDF09_003902 [Edaphobacter lichenicola]|uniref:Uncharacterized protein n=1 Tax=Tunturiibacter empetritectus TaxID=3069691 RepID=A0A7W8MSP6_9BACT|nr:hypothetical protein [Edaphobacter lichenicola]